MSRSAVQFRAPAPDRPRREITARAAIGGGTGGVEPEVWDLTYRDSYQEADEPDRSFRLYRFDCNAGAYNFSSVYLTWDSISGLKPLSFATPDFEIDYEDGDGNDHDSERFLQRHGRESAGDHGADAEAEHTTEDEEQSHARRQRFARQ